MMEPPQSATTELTRTDVEARLLSKATKDGLFRQRLLDQSQTIWREEFGNTSLKDLTLRVLEDTLQDLYLVLPAQDDVLRRELLEEPQKVWQREFGTTKLEGYTIRVIEEHPGQFCLVLPQPDQHPEWLNAVLAPTDETPIGEPEQQLPSWRSRSRPMPKTKLGRLARRGEDTLTTQVKSNPLVQMMMIPVNQVRSFINAWKRL